MKSVFRFVIIVLFCVFFFESSFAQLVNKSALGARFGSATGITYRYSFSEDRAIEGILSVQSNSTTSRFRLIGLYEYHKPINDNFSWYYGYGASVGGYTLKAFTDSNGNSYPSRSELAISLEGIVGLEYAIPTSPISVSLDIKPYFDFIQESSIRFFDPVGFSIRYKF